MSKSAKIILAVIIAILILFGLIKWVILPITIRKQAQDSIESIDFSSAELNAFNVRFMAYEGTQKGTVIKSLIKMVSINNDDNDKIVSIDFKGTTYSNSNVSSVSNLIISSDTYNVKIKYDTNGYVETISIE